MVLVTALVLAAALQPTEDVFLMPCGIPYDCATDIRVANATATWRMTFDRRWPGLFDIVHWEIAYTDGRRVEYLADLVRPVGGRLYYRFFVREWHGFWWTLGIRKRLVWRDVVRGTPEQDLMSRRLQLLYGISRALRDGADPMTLRF